MKKSNMEYQVRRNGEWTYCTVRVFSTAARSGESRRKRNIKYGAGWDEYNLKQEYAATTEK